MKDVRKFLGGALLVLVALLLTLKFKVALGWSPDFLLPVLAAAGFLLDIYSLILLILLAMWVLNWQAGLPLELWLLAAAPLAAWLGKKFLPSAPWLTLAAAIGAGEVLLYVFADTGIFWNNLGSIVANVLFAVLLGLALMNFLEYVYGKE